jgi:hypothetical protein
MAPQRRARHITQMTYFLLARIAWLVIRPASEKSTGVLEVTRIRLEQERSERERVEQELKVARSIQQASLPKEVPELEGWQISSYYRPAR